MAIINYYGVYKYIATVNVDEKDRNKKKKI